MGYFLDKFQEIAEIYSLSCIEFNTSFNLRSTNSSNNFRADRMKWKLTDPNLVPH